MLAAEWMYFLPCRMDCL